MRRAIPDRVQLEVREFGIRRQRRVNERIRVLMWRLRAEQRRAVGVVAADHVAVEHRDDLRMRHRRDG